MEWQCQDLIWKARTNMGQHHSRLSNRQLKFSEATSFEDHMAAAFLHWNPTQCCSWNGTMDVGASAWILRCPDSQNDCIPLTPKGISWYLWIVIPYRTMKCLEFSDTVWYILTTFGWFGIPKFPTLSSLSIHGGRKGCPMVSDAIWWWLPCLSPRIPAEGFQWLKACVTSERVLVKVFCTLVDSWTLGALPCSWYAKKPKPCVSHPPSVYTIH